MSGRVSAFFLGASFGSAYYYGVTYMMLHNVSKVDKRIIEIREELVGMAAVPVTKAKNFALTTILSPLKPMQQQWDAAVHRATASISSLFGGAPPKKILASKPPAATTTTEEEPAPKQ